MTRPDTSDPDEFPRFVVDALQASPGPDLRRVEAAKGLWELRILDEELARLVSDSAQMPLAGVRRRGQGGDRDVMYAFAGCEVSLRIDQARHVTGQILGADLAAVDLVTLGGRRPVEVGVHGQFNDLLHSGPFRVAFKLADGTKVTTPWAVV